ncbi:MAG: FtsW/RodA/SpoVE family cell cycle protein [Lachnospiraceae bacterium]|nr:FtsW/RodA/SpoVE family cell cycle protein [Lachnospiraceae bacterium]
MTGDSRKGKSAAGRTQRAGGNLRTVRGSSTQSTAEQRDTTDYNLLTAVILLVAFGLVMLCSAGAYTAGGNTGMSTFTKQVIVSFVGLVFMIGFTVTDYHLFFRWRFFIPIGYAASIVLLGITRVAGRSVNGATRGLYFGTISIQPGEIVKIAVILIMPWVYYWLAGQEEMKCWKLPTYMLFPGFFGALCTYLLVQNLSTALIIAGISVIVTVLVDRKPKWFAGGLIFLLLILLYLFLIFLPRVTDAASYDSFRVRRVAVWLNPEAYAQGIGYQTLQGLYALGSGGLLGKGLGKSIQKINKLPEAQNDMIFSVICEELGLFGAIVVIGLFIFLLYRLYKIAENAPDITGSLIACGIFAHMALQVILNIAVVTNTIPNTGITLPFISSGGSSIVFTMTEIGIALNISRQQGQKKRKRKTTNR